MNDVCVCLAWTFQDLFPAYVQWTLLKNKGSYDGNALVFNLGQNLNMADILVHDHVVTPSTKFKHRPGPSAQVQS